MINKQDVLNLIKDMKSRISNDLYSEADETVLDILLNKIEGMEDVTDTNVGGKWIPCSERLPKEHDSVFKKFKGTNKWSNAMFEKNSDDVNVTVEFIDGTRKTKTSHTLDGKWMCEKEYGIRMKAIAWMSLPEPYMEGINK